MIKLITVGKIKEKYLKEAIQEYEKRLTKYTKLKIIEIPDYEYNSKQEEAKEIMKYINNDYIIVLDINGLEMDSIEFSKYLDKKMITYPNITFIIGGSYGVDDSIYKIANDRISFSKLTFPHQLFRVIFLEQLYRVYKILHNETYHK